MNSVGVVAQWLVQTVCAQAQKGQERASKARSTTTTTRASSSSAHNDIEEEDAASLLDITTTTTTDRPLLFNASAASSSKSRGDDQEQSTSSSSNNNSHVRAALELGHLARREEGLYLVLHADDVHTKQQIMQWLSSSIKSGSNYYTDAFLGKLVTAMCVHGQMIVWGTKELLCDFTQAQRLLWLDKDDVVATHVGY